VSANVEAVSVDPRKRAGFVELHHIPFQLRSTGSRSLGMNVHVHARERPPAPTASRNRRGDLDARWTRPVLLPTDHLDPPAPACGAGARQRWVEGGGRSPASRPARALVKHLIRRIHHRLDLSLEELNCYSSNTQTVLRPGIGFDRGLPTQRKVVITVQHCNGHAEIAARADLNDVGEMAPHAWVIGIRSRTTNLRSNAPFDAWRADRAEKKTPAESFDCQSTNPKNG